MKNLIFLFALMIISFFPYSTRAQDSVEVVVTSQRVGPFIEPASRDYFKILSDYENFALAYFSKDSADDYTLHIFYKENRDFHHQQIELKEANLLRFGENFDNYEKIADGSYTRGSNPARLDFIRFSRKEINNKLIDRWKYFTNYTLVGETDADYSKFFPHHSWFSFSAGVVMTNFNFDELKYFTDKIDSYYKSTGYDIHPLGNDYQVGPFLRFKGTIDITQNISAAVMIDANFKSQTTKYDAVSLMGIYNFTDLMESFVPFAGLGYTKNLFKVTIQYGNVVIDSLQGRFESVSIDGGTEGIITEAGIKTKFEGLLDVGIAFNYYLLTTYKTSYAGVSPEIEPGNFGAELFFNIKF